MIIGRKVRCIGSLGTWILNDTKKSQKVPVGEQAKWPLIKVMEIKKISCCEKIWYSRRLIEIFPSNKGLTLSILDSGQMFQELPQWVSNDPSPPKLKKWGFHSIICYLSHKFQKEKSVHLMGFSEKNDWE